MNSMDNNNKFEGEMRLQRFLSSAGIASRRKSEEYILEGRVKVNGVVADRLGTRVSAGDVVEFDGRRMEISVKKYYLVNKPVDVICARTDDRGRKTLFDILEDKDPSLFNVGRLDYNSCGLIIVTNDGEFANNTIHPSSGIKKGYLVESDKSIDQNLVRSFVNGVVVEGIKYKACCIKQVSDKSVIIELTEGKKREIRVVFGSFNQGIEVLRRIYIGGIRLEDYDIKEGASVSLTLDEIKGALHGR